MTLHLPEIIIPEGDGDSGEYDVLAEIAVDDLERHVLFLLRLYAKDSKDFYEFARQVGKSAKEVHACVQKITDKGFARSLLWKARRAKHTVSFLLDHGPALDNYGPPTRGRPNARVESVTRGGLPGLGKRN